MRQTVYDTDDDLIKDFQEGGKEAFSVVYRRFQPGLYHFAKRFVSGEEAYDAVADAFVQLWQRKGNFDAVPKIERWLFVTIKNACLVLLRQQARLQHTQTELSHQLHHCELSVLESEALTTELIKLIHTEIDRLPARQREVFLLSFQEGLTPTQIAEKLSLSVKTIRNQKISAIRLLQSVLGQRAIFLHLLVLLHDITTTKVPA